MRHRFAFLLFLWPIAASSQQSEPLIFREKAHDFGDIVEANGTADVDFLFTNNSGRQVKILSVQASCGCTTPAWSKEPIAQGKTGFIRASFDPKGRPGYFSKSLTVMTDADPNPIILQIKGQVVSERPAEVSEYSFEMGALRSKTKAINMGTVYINKEAVVKQFHVMNAGTVPVHFLSVEKPPYVRVEMPAVLSPDERGVIKIIYDGRMKNHFGFASDNIRFMTDDNGSEPKSVSLFATLQEYYSLPTGEELVRAPQAVVREQSIDLGPSNRGVTRERVVFVLNKGKRDLVIRAIQGNCPCITGEVARKTIHAGDSAQIKILFTPQNRGGTQQKAITLYTNDPRNPVQWINVQALVSD